MITIPRDRKWTQTNSGDVFGTLHSCYGVNFDQEGTLQISPKSVSIYSEADDSSFGLPLSIFPFNSGYFILTADQPFFLDTSLTITELTSGSPPNDFSVNSDAVVWQNKAYCTTADDLVSYDPTGPTWTTGLKTLTSGVPHPLAVMGNFASGHLVVGNGNTVLRLDTSHSTIVTLTLNANYQVETLKYFNNNLYIGTKSTEGGEAKMFVWNGSGTSAQTEYKTGANWVFSLEEYNSSIVAITSEGQLISFTGGGFKSIANLPVYYSPYRWTSSTQRVQHRGLRTDGEILYLNLNGAVSKDDDFFFLPNQPSGVWCYDPKVGLYCRHLSTSDPLQSINMSSRNSNTITLASSIKATTGEPVLVSNAGSLTGVSANTTYFIIRVSATEIKFASSPANAQAGNAITLGGTTGSGTIKIVAYNDYGVRYGEGDAGAIGLVSFDGTTPKLFPEIVTTSLIWGHETNAGVAHLNSLSIASNIGGFTTNRIWSSQVKDSFSRLFVKYSGLNLDHERVIIKSRSTDRFGLPTEAVDGTFSTSSVVGSASDFLEQVEAGDNINLLIGNGAGQSATITEVSGDEFLLDEAISAASSTNPLTFNVDNFHLVTAITTDGNQQGVLLGETASWVQIMLELRGQNVKIEELQLVNTTNQKTE